TSFQPSNYTRVHRTPTLYHCNRTDPPPTEIRLLQEDPVVVDSKIGDRSLLDLIPASIRRLRIIQVGSADYCPCGGTHLKNSSEIGRVHILEKRSKGKETARGGYELRPI